MESQEFEETEEVEEMLDHEDWMELHCEDFLYDTEVYALAVFDPQNIEEPSTTRLYRV